MKIHYLFSKNQKIGSKIISRGTNFLVLGIEDTPSHAAILLNGRWVVESTLESGFRVIPYSQWLEINIEIEKIECNKEWTMQQIKELYRPLKTKKYDFLGVLYFGWRVLLQKLLNIKKPEHNRFNHTDKYFCCEVIGVMTRVSYEMTAPVELMFNIKNSLGEFKNENRHL